MSKSNKPKTTAKFYEEPAMVEEVYTGYLHKSPGQSALLKSVSSWKHRFFVLSKTGEDAYQLKYYTNSEKRDKSVGEIDLSKISLLFTGPEKQMWDWIQKHFSCTPASVLFLRVEDDTPKHTRDYFLIGEKSDDVNGWCNALVKAVKTQKPNKLQHTDDTLEDNRFRSISAPEKCSEPKVKYQSDERRSAPELSSLPPDHYDYPRKFSEPLLPVERKISVKEDEDEKETLEDNRFISISAPEKCSEPKVKDQSDERRSAPELSSLPPDYYDYPRKFSEPLLPVERKISVKEDEDEKDGKQDESPEDGSQYMLMASLQMKLEDDQQEADTARIQTNTSINGHESSLCNGAVNQDDKNKCETHTHVEKDICVSPNSLKNSLILTEEEGKPCVSECRQIQDSRLFHKGDQILAFNGLRTDTVEEIHTYLRRLSKDEVKLTIRRFPGSQPLYAESCLSQ